MREPDPSRQRRDGSLSATTQLSVVSVALGGAAVALAVGAPASAPAARARSYGGASPLDSGAICGFSLNHLIRH